MLQRNAQRDRIWFATPKRFSGITLLSLAASGVLLQLGSEDTEKDVFWDRFPRFSVLLIRSFGRGRPLSRWSLIPCKYRRNCTCLQRHSSRPFDMLISLKCIANALFDASGDAKKFTNISAYGMYPSFLHFLLKNPTYSLFGPTRPLSSTPCFLPSLLSLVLVSSAQVSTARPPFMNKAYTCHNT